MYMIKAVQNHGVANYCLVSRMHLVGDEIFIRQTPLCDDDEAIAEKLSRTTYSKSAKAYPPGFPARPDPFRQAIIGNTPPAYRQVSRKQLDDIIIRLSTTNTVAGDRRANNVNSDNSDTERQQSVRRSSTVQNEGSLKTSGSKTTKGNSNVKHVHFV